MAETVKVLALRKRRSSGRVGREESSEETRSRQVILPLWATSGLLPSPFSCPEAAGASAANSTLVLPLAGTGRAVSDLGHVQMCCVFRFWARSQHDEMSASQES